MDDDRTDRPADPPRLRAGHDERSAAMRALDGHLEAGRLDVAEYGTRSDKAAAAIYRDELDTLFTDLPEPHATKQIEDCVAWGLDTTPDVLAAEAQGARPGRQTVEEWCRAVASPVLAMHGDHDLISPPSRGRRLAELTGGEAFDGFSSSAPFDKLAVAVIDCGGTARVGVYPMKKVKTVDIHATSPAGPWQRAATGLPASMAWPTSVASGRLAGRSHIVP